MQMRYFTCFNVKPLVLVYRNEMKCSLMPWTIKVFYAGNFRSDEWYYTSTEVKHNSRFQFYYIGVTFADYLIRQKLFMTHLRLYTVLYKKRIRIYSHPWSVFSGFRRWLLLWFSAAAPCPRHRWSWHCDSANGTAAKKTTTHDTTLCFSMVRIMLLSG